MGLKLQKSVIIVTAWLSLPSPHHKRDSKVDLKGQRSPGILDSDSSYCPFLLRVTFSFDMHCVRIPHPTLYATA